MARTGDPHSATSQFFINVKDNHALDFGIKGAGYAVFGEVLEGMDVVDRIKVVPTTSKGPHDDVPVTPVVIKAARVAGTATSPAKVTPKPAGGTAPPQALPRPGGTRPAPRRPASPKPTPSPGR